METDISSGGVIFTFQVLYAKPIKYKESHIFAIFAYKIV